ncbi:MAG TPA: PAS domain-containing sensor histidine kinase, partial [Candidatus Lokiarchaeia archaeon]
ITEVKSSKLKLKKLKQALQELDALIESSPLPIFLIDAKGKILRANEEAGLLVRYSKTELVNSKIFDLFIQDSLEIAKKYYKESIYISSINKRIEMSIKRKDRKIIDVEITSKIINIEDQIVIQSIFSDISERKEFEINRQSLLDQLYISLEFKSKFLTSTSHELRTPLNSILGFSQLLLEESYGKLNIEQKDFIKDINSAGSHLLTLINSILDMSRIEAGKLELYREKFRLKEIIENINSIIKPLYEKKNLIFNIKGINDSDEIIADILRFKQILFNLLSNAINFTNEGSITLYGIQRTDHWEFQVQDTGIGIKKEDFILIFKEFGRINNDLSQEVQGAGLGLALTKRLVQLHGGEIWFESEFGKGTIFYITIPMV